MSAVGESVQSQAWSSGFIAVTGLVVVVLIELFLLGRGKK